MLIPLKSSHLSLEFLYFFVHLLDVLFGDVGVGQFLLRFLEHFLHLFEVAIVGRGHARVLDVVRRVDEVFHLKMVRIGTSYQMVEQKWHK